MRRAFRIPDLFGLSRVRANGARPATPRARHRDRARRVSTNASCFRRVRRRARHRKTSRARASTRPRPGAPVIDCLLFRGLLVVFACAVALRRAPGCEGKARTCTTPAAKPAAPPLKARCEASFMTSPKVIFFFFSGSLPASWPMAGMGASARSLLVKPALSEASAGLARALRVNPRRGICVWSSVADMVVAVNLRACAEGVAEAAVDRGRRVHLTRARTGKLPSSNLIAVFGNLRLSRHPESKRRAASNDGFRFADLLPTRGLLGVTLLEARKPARRAHLFSAFVVAFGRFGCSLSRAVSSALASDGRARHEAAVGRRDPRRGPSRGGDPRAGRQRRGLEGGGRVVAVARRTGDDGGARTAEREVDARPR